MLEDNLTATPPQNQPTTDTLDGWQEFALYHQQQADRCSQQAIEHAWHAGAGLAQVKKRLPHGRWYDWLEANGIGRETARQWMRFAAEVEIASGLRFTSITEALRSLPPKRKALPENNLTPREPVNNFGPLQHSDGTPAEVHPVEGDPNGYEPIPPADLDDIPPPAEVPDVGEVSETDMLRFRAEEAERRRDELGMELEELQDRADVVLANDSDDSRAGGIWKETEAATAATEVARAELARVQGLLSRTLKNEARKDRKLNAIKADLLKGATADAVLLKHWRVTSKKAGQE